MQSVKAIKKFKSCLDAGKANDWLAVERMFKEGYTLQPELTELASETGQKWALEMLHEFGCEWGDNVLYIAAANDHRLCFEFALVNGAMFTVDQLERLLSLNVSHDVTDYFNRLFDMALSTNLFRFHLYELMLLLGQYNMLERIRQIYTLHPSFFNHEFIHSVIVRCVRHSSHESALYLLPLYLQHHHMNYSLLATLCKYDMYLPHTKPVIQDMFEFAPQYSLFKHAETFKYFDRKFCNFNYITRTDNTLNPDLLLELPQQHRYKNELSLLLDVNKCFSYFFEHTGTNTNTLILMLSYYPTCRPYFDDGLVKQIIIQTGKILTVELYLQQPNIFDPVIEDWLHSDICKPMYNFYLQAISHKTIDTIPSKLQHLSTLINSFHG